MSSGPHQFSPIWMVVRALVNDKGEREIINIEDLGFFPVGEGYRAAEEGLTARTGPRPINSSGGLKSKGHPVGASGAGQVLEMWKQLRGTAGERQIPGTVDLGLTHNVGGTGQTCVVHIFERR